MLSFTSINGAAQPASSGGAAQPAHDDEAMLNFTSLREIGAWLETLPHVGGDAELRSIQEAVQVLQKPTKQVVEHICAQLQQSRRRNRKHFPLAVIVKSLKDKVLDSSNSAQRRVAAIGGVAQPAASSGAAEPTEQVLDASNGMDLRRKRTLRSAANRAEQLADEETDVVAGAVGATRSDEMIHSLQLHASALAWQMST